MMSNSRLPLSSAEVQAFVIKSAEQSVPQAQSQMDRSGGNSVPALTLLGGSTPPEKKTFNPLRRREAVHQVCMVHLAILPFGLSVMTDPPFCRP